MSHPAQAARMAEAVPRWISTVPLYRQIKADIPSESVMSCFPKLPQITKREIRRNFPRNFLPPGVDLETLLDKGSVELEHTSGTSDIRTSLILARGWWAEQEERALRLNRTARELLDATDNPRRATLSSPVCNGDVCYTGVPSRSDRIVGNTLYTGLSKHPFLWAESELARMADETAEWQPAILDVDPVYGALFARYCEPKGIHFPSLRLVLCSYEFVSVNHRRIIERAFKAPVYNLYGSTETGHLLMEDETGRMRPSLSTAFLEIVDPDEFGVGDLVVTTLTNEYMPLIRYSIGDLAERAGHGPQSSYRVHGRAADAFVTPSGRRVTTLQLDRAFTGLPGVAHYQLLQQSNTQWLLRYAPDHIPPTPGQLDELRERLLLALGSGAVLTIEQTDILMPESSGKFRLGYPLTPSFTAPPARS